MKTIKQLFIVTIIISMIAGSACKNKQTAKSIDADKDTFTYFVEKFADLKIMRYQIPGFDNLSLQQKELAYYLSQAALCGDDITWDQNYKYNLTIKRTLTVILENYTGDRKSEDWKKFLTYAKRVFFSKGIHHHYSKDKFLPEITPEYFASLIQNSEKGTFPTMENETVEQLTARITPVIFDPSIAPKGISLEDGVDLIKASATNFYEGVSQMEVEKFYASMKNDKDTQPISYGLNSKVVKEKGKLVERVYKQGGMYGAAIEKIIYWLTKASEVAENKEQKTAILELIEYYKSGDLKMFDQYSVSWVKDVKSSVDVVNGFIESYGDPLDMKATWESVVNFKNIEATKRSELISANAQWFEDNSPVDPKYRKKEVKGVTAKVITTVQLSGGCYPATPIGINLPNANWIRKDYGSKSVTMDNIMYAYDQAVKGDGFQKEFAWDENEIKLAEDYGYLVGNITTDLHECLGHGSGQLAEGVSPEALKQYGSTLEEARSDLFALYYIYDNKVVDLGLIPNLDAAKAEYISYIRNGLLTQLRRIQPGKNIEESHMRNRQLIASWVYEKGKAQNVIELKVKDGKTYTVINDYNKLRSLFGDLLKEIQRIKSEGDFEAGKALVETYGVKVDQALHKEVLDRVEKLNLASFGGFINPVLIPVEKDGKITDIKIEYPADFVKQILDYSKKYSFLPAYN